MQFGIHYFKMEGVNNHEVKAYQNLGQCKKLLTLSCYESSSTT